MYRIIIFTFQILILLIFFTFVFSYPFSISLDIANLKYTFSSNILFGILIFFLFIVYIGNYIFFRSRLSINKFFLKNKYSKIQKGYQHFMEGMISIANKDHLNASKSLKKMSNYFKEEPSLSLLLKSEVYKIEKRLPELIDVYETMIKSNKTEALGYRGLMEQNLNNGDYHHAFLYGEKLFNINPKIEKLYETLIYICAKTKNWNQLILISDKAYYRKIISKKDLYENKSIGYYEIAQIKFQSDPKEATKNITKALEYKKNFPPYIKLHLEIISSMNNLSLLKRMIKKYWTQSPTNIIRSIITKIISENDLGNLTFVNQIINNNSNDEESKKMLIFFAIKNQDWDIARSKISGLIGAKPSREICLFMADIELGENNDKQKSDSWILRSEGSTEPNIWTCKITNKSQENWNSLSETGFFNSLVLTDHS